MNKAFFFDRDGIVNHRIIGDYVKNINEFRFKDEFFQIFETVKSQGYLAILVTNQQGIGKGLMTEEDLRSVHDFMQEKLQARMGYCFDDIYYCPDLKETGSFYRKPNPGMILEAIKKWDIDISTSWMLGDNLSDAQAGNKAGLKTILIGDYQKTEAPEADYIFGCLEDAVGFVGMFIR